MVRTALIFIATVIIVEAFFHWGLHVGNRDMKAAALRAEVAQINEVGEFEFKRIVRFDECNKDGSC